MYKIVIGLLIFFTIPNQTRAQILPKEGSKLCWRLIGFTFPAEKGVISYKIEISAGTHYTEGSFEKNMITSVSGKKNKIIAEVPSFGKEYTWRTISVTNNNVKAQSALYHFSTKITPDVDINVKRLRILKSAEKYKDAYVFIDGSRVLYDMKGAPVWFLPGTDMKESRDAYPRDLKVTPQGTITFTTSYEPYEITYAGNILWSYQTDTNVAKFHHEFTRLGNGHYMSLVLVDVSGKIPVPLKDQPIEDAYDSSGYFRSRLFSSIVEFDEKKNLVWSWSGLAYENTSDMRLRQFVDFPKFDCDLHENSFFFDEKNKTVYLSFRNISRIIKIKYPEGTVLNTYGTVYKPGSSMDNNMFSFQHSCRRSQKGYLYLFNNNVNGTSHLPTIVMFQEPGIGKNDLKKIWEYKCTVEGMDSAEINKMRFNRGGNVIELPDQSFFVCMGEPYPKVFIVGLNKKVLWSGIPEKYDQIDKQWEPDYRLSYRASIISRKELEQLIWHDIK